MRKIVELKVVEETPSGSSIDELLADAVADGFEPMGGVAVYQDRDSLHGFSHVLMVKYKDVK